MSQGLCPSCGAAVNLTAGQTESKCQYCESTFTLWQAETQLNDVRKSKAGGSLLLGQISLASLDYVKALVFYEKAIEQDDKSPEAWFGRAVCLGNIQTGEPREKRIKATEAVSCWEAAILFAANPDAMAKRAAKAIAEAVSSELEYQNLGATGDFAKEVDWGAVNEERVRSARETQYPLALPVFLNIERDYHELLAWAWTKDPQNEFLLKTGADFYSRAIPFAELREKYRNVPDSMENPSKLFREYREKYLSALRQVDVEAAGKCDVTFRKFQSAASGRYSARAEEENIPPSVMKLIRKGGSHKIAAIKELLSIRPGLGLAEAKKIVEETGAQLGTMSASKSGCFVDRKSTRLNSSH